MGQKVDPRGFRLGISRGWEAKWFATKDYGRFLQEDLKLRKVIAQRCRDSGVSSVEVERLGDEIYLTIYAVHPGILIGRGGQNIERLKKELQGISSGEVKLTIREVERPELEACPVAQNIAERIENRIPFRRVMKQAAFRTLEAGAKGIKIKCSGRIGGREIARSETLHQGQMPLHKLSADISYGFVEARTAMGRIGVKTWIYRGDIPEKVMKESVTTETG